MPTVNCYLLFFSLLNIYLWYLAYSAWKGVLLSPKYVFLEYLKIDHGCDGGDDEDHKNDKDYGDDALHCCGEYCIAV